MVMPMEFAMMTHDLISPIVITLVTVQCTRGALVARPDDCCHVNTLPFMVMTTFDPRYIRSRMSLIKSLFSLKMKTTTTTQKTSVKRGSTSATTATFCKKATSFLGFTTHFLKDHLIAKLNYPVKVVRCKSSSTNGLRIGLANMSCEDKAVMSEYEHHLVTTFDGSATELRGIFPTQVEMNNSGSDMIFVTASERNTALFNEERERVDLREALPRVSWCRVAIAFVGLKIKDGKMSPMIRLHQLMLTGPPGKDDDAAEDNDCMFTDDSGDDDELD